MDDGAQSSHFRFGVTFLQIVRPENRILGLSVLAKAHGLQSQHIKAAACIRRTALGHTQIRPGRVAGLPDHRIKSKVGIRSCIHKRLSKV